MADGLVSSLSAGPEPATSAPPGVGDTNVKGSVPRYALEDHTHKSSVQAQSMQVAAGGVAVWAYTAAYDAPPVVEVTAHTPRNAAYLNVATIIDGSVTTTQCEIQVVRVPQQITLPTLATALLGLILNLFAPAPSGVTVSAIARKAS